MEEFLHFLQGRMDTPTWFGWFHIMWLVLMVTACVLIYIFRKRISRKGVNVTLLVAGIVLLVFEIYKQIIYSFDYNGGGGIRRGIITGMPSRSNSAQLQCF